MVTLKLTNQDDLFKEIRGLSLSALGIVTRAKLEEIQEIINNKDNPQSIKEMSTYVAKVKSMNIPQSKQRLDNHILLASLVKEKHNSNLDFN